MTKAKSDTRVIVGLSGGVDSAVAALLLQQQGYRVEGVFMKNWEADATDPYCQAEQDLSDARAVCDRLQIPLHRVNFSKEYWDNVFQNFLDEYAAGRTPNPDILCNKEIKFKVFLDYALTQGADYIATGHYARCLEQNDQLQLWQGLDQNKDQTYFLYTLGQEQLKHCLFPVGELKKPQVRELAASHGFLNHAKKDSTGICFIGERKFKDFLQEYLLTKPGNIKTETGKIVGKHHGLMFYTLGQRKGIGVGGQKNEKESPWYVIEKDLNRNELIIAQGHNHPKLMHKSLRCQQLDWVSDAPAAPFQCEAKTRYRQVQEACTVTKINADEYQVDFFEPQWAITPGQSVVFYQEQQCLGGGVIIGVI